MASGEGRPGDEPGVLRRQQSNWADEMIQRETAAEEQNEVLGPGSAEEKLGGDDDDDKVSRLSSMINTIESQVDSLEAAMDPRRQGGGLAGAYGRQVYESLGPMLQQAREASSAMAQSVQALSEGPGVPPDIIERSSALTARMDRAILAHQARCPPEELERRLSREPSFFSSSPANDATTTAAASDGASPAATASSPSSNARDDGAGSAPVVSTVEAPADPQEQQQHRRQLSANSSASRPLTRTLTLDDVVKETTEREEHHHQGGAVLDDVTAQGHPPDAGGPGVVATPTNEGMASDDGSINAPDAMVAAAAAAATTAATVAAGRNGGVRLFSFGRGDLGALLHSDDADHTADDGPVVLKDHWSVLQVSTSLFHTMAVMASGDTLGCGQNNEGQVRPDLPSEEFLMRPSLVEPVLSHRVTQVSCGLYHTACVTASGVALTWGGNEAGQLGHSGEALRMVRPMAVQVAEAGQAWSSRRRAVRVACGDLFTLILTSRAEIFSCGVGECVGGDGTDRRQAAFVQSLAGFPAVWMACGNSHSVVIGAGGEAVAFGLNTHGQLGVGEMTDGEGPAVLLPRPIFGTFSIPLTGSAFPSPRKSDDATKPANSNAAAAGAVAAGGGGDGESPRSGASASAASARASTGNDVSGATPPAFLAARAACGQSHTVLVSTSGEAWVCGRNRSGQLGIDPDELAETPTPVRVPLEVLDGDRSALRGLERGGGKGGAAEVERDRDFAAAPVAVQAAAGRAHTLLLLSDGDVVGFGSDEFGALGTPPRADDSPTGSTGAGDGRVSMEVDSPPSQPSYHWKPTVIEALKDRWVASVSAGGEQSFALALDAPPVSAAVATSTAAPPRPIPLVGLGQASAGAGDSSSANTAVPISADGGPSATQQRTTVAAAAATTTTVSTVSVSSADTARFGGGSGGGDGVGGKAGVKADDTGAPIARQGSEAMFLRRRFSIPTVTPRMRTVGEFMQLIRRAQAAAAADGAQGKEGGGSAAESAVVEAVRQTFASPSVLSGSFNVDPPAVHSRDHHLRGGGGGGKDEGSGGAGEDSSVTKGSTVGQGRLEKALPRVDAEGLDAVYAGLVGLGARVSNELVLSIEEGMAAVRASQEHQSSAASAPLPIAAPPSLEAAGVSFLLKYWQASFSTQGEGGVGAAGGGVVGVVQDETLERICKTVLGLKGRARWWLMRSAKEDYPPALFSSRLVKPMVAHLATWVKQRGRQGWSYPSAALLLKWLHSINELEAVPKIPYEDFFSDALSSLPLEVLLQDLVNWKEATPAARKKRFFLSEHAFLFSTSTKKALLQAEAELEQHKAARATGPRFVSGLGFVFNPFLVLQVHRSHLLQETLAQVSQIPDSGLRKKLKVVFRGEEGVDEGGVAKEFFQLLTVQLFDQSFGMFVPAGKEGRALWFNKDCVWADEEYGLVGLLVGLAVYSGVILDLPLPLVVFKKLLGEQLALKDLGDIDPDLLQGFQRLLDYDGGDDEDVFGIDFRVTWDDLGMQRSHDLVEGGADVPVTAANKHEYVELYTRFLLMDAVSRQFDRFKQGFLRVMSGASSISLLRAEELEVLVTGTPELDFDELAKATEYDGGFGEDHPTVQAFWHAVGEMPPEEQRRLLMFVTGSKKAPLGGLGKLSFKIQRAGPDTDHLPTSHTCFNVLMLPEYSNKEKLTRLLKIAITECEGFGLK